MGDEPVRKGVPVRRGVPPLGNHFEISLQKNESEEQFKRLVC